MARTIRWALGGILLGLAAAGAGGDAAPSPGAFGEYEVKAALVYKLAKFIDWPGEAFREAPERHAFCVVGRGPMGPALERVVEGKTVGGRKVVVKKGLKVEELPSCQIVFLGTAEAREHARILAALRDRPVLLVGETACFTARGGMVNLVVEDDRIRFEINPGKAEEAGLRISANLLKLARIVESEEECDEDVPPRE